MCLKGTKDVISSDLPFMEWHFQHTFRRQENAGIFKSSIDISIHVTIGNRAWPSLNGRSLEIIIMCLTSLKNRHLWGSSNNELKFDKALLHGEQ